MSAQVAVVGSGLAGFTAYQTLRRALEPGEIAVFGTDADPAAAWRVRAAAIRQRQMRSESDGHCLATTFPGLAFGSVLRRRSLRPLLESGLDRYHPTVEEFLSHVERLRERSRWDESLVVRRVERVRAVDGGFDLEGDRFRHVLLAPGHPGLNVPEELRDDPRVVHSYERPGRRSCQFDDGSRYGARSTSRATTSPVVGSPAFTACRRASESSACAPSRLRRTPRVTTGTSRSSDQRRRAGSGWRRH